MSWFAIPRRPRIRLALAVVLVVAFLGAVSCGGSSGSSVTQPIASPGTTRGAYTVSVSGVPFVGDYRTFLVMPGAGHAELIGYAAALPSEIEA